MTALLTDGVVGREQELNSVDEVIAAIVRGEFRALVVHGAAGIGKTRLLSELVRRASAHDAIVCWGSATEFERHVPFAVYRDAFADVAEVAGISSATLAALEGSNFTDVDRYRLFHQVRGLLKWLAVTRPTVLVLDDLHWADQSAVELTGHLLRRPPGAGLLIAVAYRPASAPAGVADAAFHLGPAAAVLGLGPLTTADVDVLLPGESKRRRRLLYLGSGGNPLYLRALAAAGDETLAHLAGTGDAHTVPERALLDVFCADLDRLDLELQHVARAAAVAGDPAALDLVAWIAERSEPQVAYAVDDLDRLGVLTTTGDSRLRFQHPLVRTAAYWRAGGGWRSRAHARAAQFLRARHGPLQVVAHHIERSAHPGDGPAANILAEAGTACLHTAPETAARLLRAALRIMPEAPALAGRRADLQLALARALGVTGQLAESRSLLQEVMRTGGQRRVEAVTFASVLCRLVGQFDEAKALLAGELAQGRDDGRAAAHALVELVAVELARKDPMSAQRYGDRALLVTAATGDLALEAAASALLALGHLQLGRTVDAERCVERSALLVDGCGDAVVLPYIELVAPLAWVELHLQRYDAARRHLDRGMALAHRHGRSHGIPYLLITAAALHIRSGQSAEAVSVAAEARELSRLIHGVETAAMATAVTLKPVLWRDGPRVAVKLAREVVRRRQPCSGWWSDIVELDLATVYLAAQDPARCLATLSDSGPERGPWRPGVVAYRSALCAVANAELDRLGPARELADEALAQAREIGLSHQIAAARDARARVLARAGLVDEAVAEAAAAAAGYAEARAPIEEGTARHLTAQLHALAGRLDRARSELGQAKDLFAAYDAGWLNACLVRTERQLAAMGPRTNGPARRQRPPVSGIDLLTGREREVVRLAATGMTNREIATRLYLSQKTVEAHISRSFAKLGVRSRVALARRVFGAEAGEAGEAG
ncbi:LuxR family transcriptional regulator [Micromonospora sp. KC606]|uniref:helix-turn-helix transcriptional regulator n=1 Tax=Micromonospora sp. KC606 TaxID=2530379 RepID=UPI0014051319|nr:LuxR family transcriptional regulator [Micromonospora sp. KC606]